MNRRKPLTLRNLAEACSGTACGTEQELDTQISEVAIDDRKVKPGALFVPIRGERFDGHDFITRAVQNGAFAVISERPLEEPGVPWVHVNDTVAALQAAARLHREYCGPLTVAVTGSVGKTTTKEMIASVLEQKLRTVRTEGNLNNQTGVPLTLFTIEPDTQAAVVEMGMNHAGEIDRIACAAAPDIGIITNIGTAHIEYLGSREGILAAKTELLPHITAGGRVFVNGDDDLLSETAKNKPGISTFGFDEGNDLRAINVKDMGLNGTDFDIVSEEVRFAVHIPSPGRYMVYAALAAAACGLAAGLSPEEIARGISLYKPTGSRMRILRGGITIIDDTYNANAPAMKAALDVLAGAEGRKIAILGEMRELGSESDALHREVTEYAEALPLDLVITAGEAYKGNIGNGSLWFETQEELLENIGGLVRPGDTVLVKASRGMHMEDTVRQLESFGTPVNERRLKSVATRKDVTGDV